MYDTVRSEIQCTVRVHGVIQEEGSVFWKVKGPREKKKVSTNMYLILNG